MIAPRYVTNLNHFLSSSAEASARRNKLHLRFSILSSLFSVKTCSMIAQFNVSKFLRLQKISGNINPDILKCMKSRIGIMFQIGLLNVNRNLARNKSDRDTDKHLASRQTGILKILFRFCFALSWDRNILIRWNESLSYRRSRSFLYVDSENDAVKNQRRATAIGFLEPITPRL